MAKFNEIQRIIENLPSDFKTERIKSVSALGRILQEDVIADMDMPPFDKSAMDGYACRFDDLGNEMEVLEVISAGKIPVYRIGKNQCSKIMTGAMLPEGADGVFMVEDAEVTGQNKVQCTNPGSKKNICYQGEDYTKGTVLVQRETILSASHLAVMAGAGYDEVRVSALPEIAIITTGSELVEPGEKPGNGKIRNSNAHQITVQLQQMRLPVNYMGLAGDDYDILTQLFKEAFLKNDIVIFTGGASVGDFDWIPHLLKEKDFAIHWEKTGMKPGNPMIFASKGNKYCFGLSGNPVSSLVQFSLIAGPVLYRLLGANYQPMRMRVPLAGDFSQRKANRFVLVPVHINNEGSACILPFHGSAHINALVYANAIMEVPEGTSALKNGELVYVRPL
ncbi:MAG: molybdopterin molybdotransferase MoeA [Bacteroidales bacterium]